MRSLAARTRLATALVALSALDLALILISGRSVLAAGAGVGGWGFALRAAALGGLLVLRFRVLPERPRRMEGGRLALLLMLLPALVQFDVAGGRLSGVDSISYYVFLRSMVKDRDFDLTNEYAHYGMITRWDLAQPTRTGLRRSIYSVGPAVVWTPFFLLGEGVARLEGLLTGRPPDLSGYGRAHVNAVALGSLLYGFGALLLVHALLRRHFSSGTALGAVLLVWGATFFHWYLVIQPTYSHSASTLLAAYALWLWDRDRGTPRSPWAWFYLGLVLGVGMCVRWQNGVLLLLPGLELLLGLVGEPGTLRMVLASGGLVGLGTAIGAFPQMAAWKALYDMWILPYPPQGTDFLRFGHPWILETLFSSRHGLLSWTPALWAGYLGFLPLARRRPAIAATLLLPLLLMTYVNLCVGDWWGGGSFSNRRFDSLLPILAFGLAASIDAARSALRARPAAALGLLALPFVAWNGALALEVERGLVPRDDTVSFAQLAGGAARVVEDAVGFPTTWPASWIFAWRHGLSPGRYDLLVGRYLFYRQNSIGGRIDLGSPAFDFLLGEGWGPIATRDGVPARRLAGPARIFLPLDVPEDLEVGLRAASEGDGRELAIRINGQPAGRIPLQPGWTSARIRAGAPLWHRELNEVGLEGGGGEVWVSVVDVTRVARRR